MILLNLPYFGCIAHWAQIVSGAPFAFETRWRHQRRTFRTRTVIGASDGELALTLPSESDYTKLYTEACINDATPWRHQHLNAFMSAYSSSPFYEFYIDDIAQVVNTPFERVWDMNMKLHETLARLMDIDFAPCDYDTTHLAPEDIDMRRGIEPKQQHILREGLTEVPYYQVFAPQHGFLPWLSVLDLLFEMGPEARLVLLKMSGKAENSKVKNR
ncbi:MAG: WbqC family protein [Marinilabiliaceae bacterium]|mgnify:FL=1|nr:WbqC family protein [Marinilabiliaceae bacterium]